MSAPPSSSDLGSKVISDFGHEWQKFDHAHTDEDEERAMFEIYFANFPWETLPPSPVGFDLGCGSGRWAFFAAPRAGVLHCIDPSPEALAVAKSRLAHLMNCRFHCAQAQSIPLPDASADFAYCLGVLHHLEDPAAALRECVRKLRLGAPLLLYLYYAFDNRPAWFRWLWKVSELGRKTTSRLPYILKVFVSELAALFLYWPLARFALLSEQLGAKVCNFPLAAYRHRSFYQMRNDALDRFGTRLEKRFRKQEMIELMQSCGLENITFADFPFWCAVGYRKAA